MSWLTTRTQMLERTAEWTVVATSQNAPHPKIYRCDDENHAKTFVRDMLTGDKTAKCVIVQRTIFTEEHVCYLASDNTGGE